MILDAFWDAFLDTAKTVPFLLIAFLILETLEHYSNNFMNRALGHMGKAGPLVGAVFGCIPQCGFSVAAANLYSGGVITLGTLMAVFLSTSDEAILILFSHPGSGSVILKLLAGKLLIGIAAGYLLDFLLRGKKEHKHIEDMCRGCGCSDDSGIVKPAVRHTIQLTIYVFVFTAALNLVLGLVGMDALTTFLGKDTWFQPFLTALLGLIPNCASSILITELYLAGGLSLASAMGGLCAGAGVGLAVLFRENHPAKENVGIVALLYLISAGAGLLLEVIL
ncbi:arsenic efflux protein [Anaerosacchariphilus sp. NSJ-68]|uniref:Arsenic efflux protein n=2 Tax=Lachnospiraceae TaxID=186803 RepID=A0A923LDH3_9FIRM|nr:MULTISPECIES: putative manganese transporter [Lachnospiraceae]MBC5660149.1 arsenic efflux protein [Anaerosacchariphilus hominis]MBC5699264.1 arsenic efflux protein [Roseburia difficilis]